MATPTITGHDYKQYANEDQQRPIDEAMQTTLKAYLQGQGAEKEARLKSYLQGQAQSQSIDRAKSLQEDLATGAPGHKYSVGISPEGAAISEGDQNPFIQMNRAAGTEANRINAEVNHVVKPFQDQVSRSLESLQNLMSGTATGDQIAEAGKAMIVHGGGQVPGRLIQAFGGDKTAPGKIREFFNNLSGQASPKLDPEIRNALGDALWLDVERGRQQGTAQMQRIRQQGKTLAPTMTQTGTLDQHLSGFSDPNEDSYASTKNLYGQWKSGQTGLPAPGQASLGPQISQSIGVAGHKAADAAGGLAGWFKGLLGGGAGAQSAPAQAAPAPQAQPQPMVPAQAQPSPQMAPAAPAASPAPSAGGGDEAADFAHFYNNIYKPAKAGKVNNGSGQ